MRKEELLEILKRELPTAIQQNPEIREFIRELIDQRLLDFEEKRAEMLRKEAKAIAKEIWDEADKRWQERFNQWRQEQDKKWEDWKKSFWEESDRRWQERFNQWRQEQDKKWEQWRQEQDKKWEAWKSEWQEWRKNLELEWREWRKDFEERILKILVEFEERILKTIVELEERMIKNQKNFEERVLEIIKEFEERNNKTIEGLKTKIDTLGSRWERSAEESFRDGVRGLLTKYAKVSVSRYHVYDDEGITGYKGRPIEIDMIIQNEKTILAEIKSRIDPDDVFMFINKVRFYEYKEKKKPDYLIMIGVDVRDDARKIAQQYGIIVYPDITDIDEQIKQL